LTQPDDCRVPKRVKVSWFFFSKKNCFLRGCLALERESLSMRIGIIVVAAKVRPCLWFAEAAM
jgi:hypothetical protein